jgi:hypothetical protein
VVLHLPFIAGCNKSAAPFCTASAATHINLARTIR